MKKLLTIILLFILPGMLLAQEPQLHVKSFRKLQDLDARVNEPKKDQNGDLCAIIKVVTTQTGFTFDCGQIGIIKTVQKPSEIWVYVPYGAKRLTISHTHLGILRDYQIPVSIEKATSYELVLISGSVVTTVQETIVSQWLVIIPDPKDAMIYLDDKFVKNGTFQAKIKPGTHTYRVEASKYHTEAGKIEITNAKKELSVKLKPAFGYVTVSSEPESGAKVIIDGEAYDLLTPCTSNALSSGEHTIQVIKDLYQPAAQKIAVIDGDTISVKLTLNPNFADISIMSSTESEIFVDNLSKGTGAWKGQLGSGVYSLETRRENFRTAKKDIEVVAGENQNIELVPTPIYGLIDIISDPAGATITIDGKESGTTPSTFDKLQIGNHNIQLVMPGYFNVNKMVNILEGTGNILNEILKSDGTLAVKSKPSAKKEKPVTIAVKPPETNDKPTDKNITSPDNNVTSQDNNVTSQDNSTDQVVNRTYSPKYYKYKSGKAIWLVSTLVTGGAGAYCYLQANDAATKYKNATSDAPLLADKADLFNTITPICLGVAGFSALEFIIKASKQSKEKKQSLGFYPKPIPGGAGFGLTYNF
jgi:hypothetical protein